jgi:hypothetical protein
MKGGFISISSDASDRFKTRRESMGFDQRKAPR